jgi:hypothetical protein
MRCVQKYAFFWNRFDLKGSCYQDRLGTNVGRVERNGVFWQDEENAAMQFVSGSHRAALPWIKTTQPKSVLGNELRDEVRALRKTPSFSISVFSFLKHDELPRQAQDQVTREGI